MQSNVCREAFLEKLELALEWEEESHCTAHWQLFCRGECPSKKSRNSGNWKTPPQSCSSPNCNTTLETLMGSEEDFTPVEV